MYTCMHVNCGRVVGCPYCDPWRCRPRRWCACCCRWVSGWHVCPPPPVCKPCPPPCDPYTGNVGKAVYEARTALRR